MAVIRLCHPPAMVQLGRSAILADGRPIRLGGRPFDVLMALIEAATAVVSKDEFLSRVRQGRIVHENSGHKIAALRKGFSAGRELIPMVADGFTGSPARSVRSAGGGGQVRPDRHERVHRGSVERAAGSP